MALIYLILLMILPLYSAQEPRTFCGREIQRALSTYCETYPDGNGKLGGIFN